MSINTDDTKEHRIARLEERVDRHDSTLASHDVQLRELKQDFRSYAEVLRGLRAQVTSHNQELARLSDVVEGLRDDFRSIGEWHDRHSSRLLMVEKALDKSTQTSELLHETLQQLLEAVENQRHS